MILKLKGFFLQKNWTELRACSQAARVTSPGLKAIFPAFLFEVFQPYWTIISPIFFDLNVIVNSAKNIIKQAT